MTPPVPEKIADPSGDRDVYKISARLPNFWPETPDLYFLSVEASFKLSNIVSEKTMFLSLIAALDQQTMMVVSDLIRNPDPVAPYSTIKERLIKEFTVPEVRRIQSVLGELALGDLRPSAFLRKMREQAGSGFTDSGLRSVWLSHMPSAVQSILSTIDKDLTGLAETADQIFNVTGFDKSHACDAIQKTGLPTGPSPSSGLDTASDLQAQIDELRRDQKSLHAKVDRLLKKQNSYSGARGRSFSRRTVEAGSSKSPDLCWYHAKYADKALKCIEPCSWETKN